MAQESKSSAGGYIGVVIRDSSNKITRIGWYPRNTTLEHIARQCVVQKVLPRASCICQLRIRCDNKTLAPSQLVHRTLGGLTSRNTIILPVFYNVIGGGLANVWEQNGALQVGTLQRDKSGNLSRKPVFAIPTFHVSCRSDKIYGQDMMGIVLYLCDNKTLFYLNGMKCQAGYILLVNSNKLEWLETKDGTMHSKAFKFFMRTDLQDMNIVGGGFSIQKGQPVFRSGTFNAATVKFHDGRREMHEIEKRYITLAVRNWKRGVQNTHVKDYCGLCGVKRFY